MKTTMNSQELLQQKENFWQKNTLGDWLFALFILLFAGATVLFIFHHKMDGYETAIFILSTLGAIILGWFFKPLRIFLVLLLAASFLSIWLYQGQIDSGNTQFLLKYILASQSAIMWQCALIILSFVCFLWGAVYNLYKNSPKDNLGIHLGIAFAWASAFFGSLGLLVRWHESYLLRPDAGHIPLSNLYEVFILFMVILALMFLYYAIKHQLKRLGIFVFFLECILVSFTLWYSISSQAHEIQPLIPALQSWWMKIHVPANFIGYGGFCLAAMLGVAELLAIRNEQLHPGIKGFLPPSDTIEEIMYQAIAIGFLFFSIATILGALWAAEAWGRYWSWDPKETWALIVWLNYAAWLHMRLVAGWRGKTLAWWAISGLLITAFAFVGVNKFLSGLHSYGNL